MTSKLPRKCCLLNPSSNQRNSLGHGALLDGPNPARAELKEQDAPCAHLLRLSPSLPWLKPEQLRMTTECVLVCSAPPGARARHSGNDAWSLALHHDVVCAGGWQRLGDGAGRVLLRLDVSLQAPLCQVQGGRSRVCQVCTSSATGQGRCFSQPAACPPRLPCRLRPWPQRDCEQVLTCFDHQGRAASAHPDGVELALDFT